jgi:hypothetical protein
MLRKSIRLGVIRDSVYNHVIINYYMFNIKSLSLLVINSSSILNLNISSYIIMSISYSTIITSRYSINIVYLDSLLIIAKITSNFTLIRGSFNSSSLVIKSIITIYYFLLRALLG